MHAKQERDTREAINKNDEGEFEAVAKTAEQQARHLSELNRLAIESGVDGEVSDDQVIKLMRQQSAIAVLILTLTNDRMRK